MLSCEILGFGRFPGLICVYDDSAVDSGEQHLPGAPSLSKSLSRLGSMLPRRRPDTAGQDMPEDECEEDANSAPKSPLAKTKPLSKVLQSSV